MKYDIAEIRNWLANMKTICSESKWDVLLNSPNHLLMEELKDAISFEDAKKILILCWHGF